MERGKRKEERRRERRKKGNERKKGGKGVRREGEGGQERQTDTQCSCSNLSLGGQVFEELLFIPAHGIGGEEEVVYGSVLVLELVHTVLQVGD